MSLQRVAAVTEQSKAMLGGLLRAIPLSLTPLQSEKSVCFVTILSAIEEKAGLTRYVAWVFPCICIEHVVSTLQPKVWAFVLLAEFATVSQGMSTPLCGNVSETKFAKDTRKAEGCSERLSVSVCATVSGSSDAGCTVSQRATS